MRIFIELVLFLAIFTGWLVLLKILFKKPKDKHAEEFLNKVERGE